MLEYFWGAGDQLYYFQGFGEHEQNNFREQRKIFSESWGDSGSKGALTPPPPPRGSLIIYIGPKFQLDTCIPV